MKVLHAIASISPIHGGPTQAALSMVRALRVEGIDAEVVTTNDDAEKLLDVPLNRRVEYEQVPVWFLKRFPWRMKEYLFSPALTGWLRQHIQHYELIHTHYLFSYASTCAAALACYHRIPYIASTMGQLAPWALAQSRRKKQVYSWVIERRRLNQATAIHCTAAAEAQDVVNFGIQSPTFTLPLGVDIPVVWPNAGALLRQQYDIAAETPVVLFLSRLHYKKQPDLLLRVLAQLQSEAVDFHLILAGAGDRAYEESLKQLIGTLNLTDRVSMPGFVSGKEKDLLLQGADLFVLPSFSENFGIAVAEALAAGLPAIVTLDVQIAPEIAAAQAGWVIEGDAATLKQAIAKLLATPEWRYQLGENGRLLARQRYGWPAIAHRLAAIYQTIAKTGTLPPEMGYRPLISVGEAD